MTDFEIWKDIPRCEGMYKVSNLGMVRSEQRKTIRKDGKALSTRERLLKLAMDKKGYMRVMVARNTKKVHRLVAEAFIPNPNKLPEVNHIDGDKKNNCVSNLEWMSHKENVEHAISIGKYKRVRKLSNTDIAQLKAEYVKGSKEHGTNALAKKYGLSAAYIWRIIDGQKCRTAS